MIAIAGGKGGVGKTTTTACLARALATGDETPIAVDGDCDMPDLHVVAGTAAEPGIDSHTADTPVEAVTHSAVELPGVDVLPAGRGDADALESTLDALEDTDRRVLVDTPAGASPVVATALRSASAVVVVSTATRESLEDAAKTAEMARTLGTTPIGTVLTRSDGSVDPVDLLGCPTLTHVPEVASPLTDETVERRYDSVGSLISKRNI